MATAAAALPRGNMPVVEEIDVALVDVGPNVRLNVEDLDELAASIQEHGVLQPIKVRPDGDRWTVIWGQRRLLAARKVGLETIPAIVSVEDKPAPDLAVEQLVENLHRADLPPLDRARAMRTVVDSGVSQADLARELGLHPSTIANDLGLLEAPDKIRDAIERGDLTPAHAKAMKGLAPTTQAELVKEIVRDGLSAHATEREVQERKRRAEVEAQNRANQRKADARATEQLVASIAEFDTKKVPKDALIVVDSGYGYGSDGGHARLVRLIVDAGYTNARAAKSWGEVEARPSGGLCDCTAWKAAEHSTYDYTQRVDGHYAQKHRVSITKACVIKAHREAKAQVTAKAERDKHALQERVQQHLRATAFGVAIPPTSADTGTVFGIPRILAESALWGILSYRLPEWSEKRGGARTKPWAAIHALSDEDLAKELAWEIARDFRDKAGYHVDWPALAEEFGLTDPPAKPAADQAPAAATCGEKFGPRMGLVCALEPEHQGDHAPASED